MLHAHVEAVSPRPPMQTHIHPLAHTALLLVQRSCCTRTDALTLACNDGIRESLQRNRIM